MVYAIAVYGKTNLPVIEKYHPKFLVTEKGQRYIDYQDIMRLFGDSRTNTSKTQKMLFVFRYTEKNGIDSAKWIGSVVKFAGDSPIYVELKNATVHTKKGAGYYKMDKHGSLQLMTKQNTEHYANRLEAVFKKLELL